ncbi:hypothetical protein PGT21_019340 [Puccinia graminis f. sp. tritici]|uniref:RING-type domain-containing protein n=1 Tax=Puccinia graminis f. sp. tritici TaxID=56615 RepID=A0A5B0LXR0_PUCGR|nr:hypothetical protein PGT21_019340 [Puccinia graminis f. sp. tritici]
MHLLFIFVATMLFQLIVPTPILHVSNDKMESVGANALLKSAHQHTKRMTGDTRISSESCPICQDELGENPSKWNPCGHLYHSHCMKEWQSGKEEMNTKCPVCQRVDLRAGSKNKTKQYIHVGELASSSGFAVEYTRCDKCDCHFVRQARGRGQGSSGKCSQSDRHNSCSH